MNGSSANSSVSFTSVYNEIDSLSKLYKLFYEIGDPRIRDFFLMDHPEWIIIINIIYVVISVKVLPDFMRKREAYDLQKFIFYFDLFLFVVTSYFLFIGTSTWLFIYDLRCQLMDPSNSFTGLMAVEFSWQYLMTRFLYNLHSIPFILVKRKSRLNKYLIAHHSIFPIMVWSIIYVYPGGHVTFGGWINSITHFGIFGSKIIIYLAPKMRKYWGSVLGVIHVFQFTSIIIHSLQMFLWNDCGVPMYLVWMEIIYALIIASFYYIFVIHKTDPILSQ